MDEFSTLFVGLNVHKDSIDEIVPNRGLEHRGQKFGGIAPIEVAKVRDSTQGSVKRPVAKTFL